MNLYSPTYELKSAMHFAQGDLAKGIDELEKRDFEIIELVPASETGDYPMFIVTRDGMYASAVLRVVT